MFYQQVCLPYPSLSCSPCMPYAYPGHFVSLVFLCLPSFLCLQLPSLLFPANVLHTFSVLCLQLPSLLRIAICHLTLLSLPIVCLIVNVMATKWPSILCSSIPCSYTQSVLGASNQSTVLDREQSPKHHTTFYAHLQQW